MGKVISLLTRVTALVGLMAAVPGIAHVGQVGKHATKAGAAATPEDSGSASIGDALAALTGGEFDLHGINLSSGASLFDLLNGDSGASLTPKSKRVRTEPSTFIHYVAADRKQGAPDTPTSCNCRPVQVSPLSKATCSFTTHWASRRRLTDTATLTRALEVRRGDTEDTAKIEKKPQINTDTEANGKKPGVFCLC